MAMSVKLRGVVLVIVAAGILLALSSRGQRGAPASPDEPAGAGASAAAAVAPSVEPRPRFVELGSDRCTSCRAMIPVLEELRCVNSEELEVTFIDVWDEPERGEAFGVRMIPTQVLLDPGGREIGRHTGFWAADDIRERFESLGYPMQRRGASAATPTECL
jgi:thioredoxin 1